MPTMTKSITCDALSQSCWANGEKQNYEINYDYFFSADAKARTPNYLRRMADKAFNMGYKIFRFSNGAPNSQSFPYEEISVKLKNGEAFKIEGGCLAEGLNYLKTSGYPPLLNLLKDFQDRFHGKQDWKKKDLATTAGGQAGLDQLIKLSVSPGDPVLVQSPCYTGLLSILGPLNVEILEADNGSNGICSIKLEKMLNDRRKKNLPMPKIFYICPTGNNPTGDTTSTKTKKEIYEIARKYNFLILEDDPYYLLTYENERSTSFLRLDIDNRVVRIDSFSKTIGAGYRIGYVTAAQEIVNKLNLIKESSSYCSPICQVIVHETLQKMGFDGFLDHIAVIRDFYLKNYHAILASLDKHLKDVATWKPPQAALFVWITIKNVDHIPQSFIDKCVENSVLIIPGFAFYATERRSPCIRLSFSMVNEDEIDEGVQILARLIKEELLTRAQ